MIVKVFTLLSTNNRVVRRVPLGDVTLGFLLALMIVVLWIESASYPRSSAIYPRIALGIVAFGVILLLAQVLLKVFGKEPASVVTTQRAEASSSEESGSTRDAVMVLAGFGLYLVLAFQVDYYLATFVFLTMTSFVIKKGWSARTAVSGTLFGLLGITSLHFVFVELLGVDVPSIIG